MDETTRLNLDKMIQEYGAEETTEKIRKLKHSKLIKDDVEKFIFFKKKYSRLEKTKQYKQMARKQCVFLYNNYTNIFNRLLKDELNLSILANFLSVANVTLFIINTFLIYLYDLLKKFSLYHAE